VICFQSKIAIKWKAFDEGNIRTLRIYAGCNLHVRFRSMCTLAYVHLLTPQMEAMCAFYTDQMGLTRTHRLSHDQSTLLLDGPERRILLSKSDKAGLNELGLRVFKERWSDAQRCLLGLGATWIAQHPVFEKALALHDAEGHCVVFGTGSRLKPWGITGPMGHAALRQMHKASASAPPLQNSPPGARLQHFGLGTARIAEQVAFYQHQLGFALSDFVTDEKRRLKSTFLRGSDEHHVLALFANGRPGLDHFSFEARDWNGIRDWADHFARYGTKIFWGAGRHGVGNNLFIFVHDPDKNMVEISAELDRVPLGQPAGHWAFDYKAFNLWGPAALRV
jgi:catechol 2,3-dioxygenase